MGSCTRRHFMLSTCFLQMITIIERQVFDFLGYMWAPIIVNFFQILFVIFGFYGAYHFRIKYIITYLLWSCLWIGWNAFLICFYLNVGLLDRDSDLLNLGTGSVSWFESNGYGCVPTYPTNITSEDPYRPLRPDSVDGCLLDYTIVELIHSGLQIALALLGIIGAILISYIFIDEDDRFDFMNGDAKSPQHTVVHPMYVSYSSIPTSASATMLSSKHHQTQICNHLQAKNTISHASYHNADHQQQTFNKSNNNSSNNNNNNNNFNYISSHSHSNSNSNSNTFLIHTNGSGNNFNHASTSSFNKKAYHNSNYNSYNSNQTPNASRNNTFSRMLYSSRNNKIATMTQGILAGAEQQQYYDDSTAKADQLYTHSNRRQFVDAAAAYQQHVANTPSTPYNSTHATTTPSLSYASLQNSNLNLGSAMGVPTTSLSNSNYSLTNNSMSTNNYNNSLNNNYQQQQQQQQQQHNINNTMSTGGSARFARINSKPRPPKSASYHSFKSGSMPVGNVNGVSNVYRPDIKYTQMSHERNTQHLNELPDDDSFSLHNFKGDEGITYVPFQSPTPSVIFQQNHRNNNNNSNNNISASYASIISPSTPSNINNNNNSNSNDSIIDNVNNNSIILSSSLFQPLNNNEILLENGAVLYPARSSTDTAMQPVFNVATRALQQQNVLPYFTSSTYQRAYPTPVRPTNIPLPSIPDNTQCFNTPLSPSDVTPPPPPAPRPHIFQPRSGHAPYPDLSPEVTEKYAMPTQYVPRSPVAARIARRQRQQQERMAHANAAHNFCDQIRDAPPGYVDTGFSIVRAKSDERLTADSKETKVNDASLANVDAAPHVNRRSGRRESRARPRSYCNSLVGGEGVVRCNIAADREMSIKNIN